MNVEISLIKIEPNTLCDPYTLDSHYIWFDYNGVFIIPYLGWYIPLSLYECSKIDFRKLFDTLDQLSDNDKLEELAWKSISLEL